MFLFALLFGSLTSLLAHSRLREASIYKREQKSMQQSLLSLRLQALFDRAYQPLSWGEFPSLRLENEQLVLSYYRLERNPRFCGRVIGMLYHEPTAKALVWVYWQGREKRCEVIARDVSRVTFNCYHRQRHCWVKAWNEDWHELSMVRVNIEPRQQVTVTLPPLTFTCS